MATPRKAIAAIESRSFFEQALAYGAKHGVLTDAHLALMREDGPKGIVQIAKHFGTAYLQASLEVAAVRMVNLISLYLEDKSDANLQIAAASLREGTLLSHSRGGSEMLKRLNALPPDTQLHKRQRSPDEEKSFVDDRSYAAPMRLADYRKAFAERIDIQQQIDFAHWIAGQLKCRAEEYADHTAEEVIQTALLVCYVGQEPLGLPSKTGFVKLVEQLRKPAFKPKSGPFDRLLASAPDAFGRQAAAAMQTFIREKLPALKSSAHSPGDFLFGDLAGLYFVRESLEDAVGAFDQMVSKEWVRITKGQSDPATLATIFLFIATGQPPKASLLQKEAKAIVSRFRTSGFDSAAVCQFIDQHAPFEQKSELKALWREDLKPEAEIELADPDQDDTFMDRALHYLKRTCVATWKGRS